ncbi:MAG: LPS glycosyltransferase [Parcubacteria group bacterium GW2011_GWA2_44_13]|nr:MAG: LPS glycosyltransferase [Parcubacteria group bacterium GW2011_GWA2_44_13]
MLKLKMENKKIKICYILPFYEEGTDTHLFYNYELIKKVAARKEADLFIIIEKCPKLSLGQIKESLGIKSCYAQKFKFPPLRFFELVLKCFKLRSRGYTNFYVHYSYYGAIAGWLVSNFPIFSHCAHIFYWNRGMPWLFKRGWFEEKIFRFVLRHTILVTGPESLAKEYQKRYAVREYRVLSNWVDVERFAPTSPQRKVTLSKAEIFQDFSQRDGARLSNSPAGEYAGLEKSAAEAKPHARIILFVHRLSKRKGADLIPEIAKGFGDDALFLMIGDGPEFENLKLKIENSGLKNIKLLGQVPNKDITWYFHSSSIFLMPSREEGSPHVILEAMASGVPFIASDIGGVREIVPKEFERFLCPSEDVKCFQDKIKTLLANSGLYENTRAQCLNHAQKFDISRGINEFIDLFK